MLAVQIFSGDEKRGSSLAGVLAALAGKRFPLQIIGPAPASISRINDIF